MIPACSRFTNAGGFAARLRQQRRHQHHLHPLSSSGFSQSICNPLKAVIGLQSRWRNHFNDALITKASQEARSWSNNFPRAHFQFTTARPLVFHTRRAHSARPFNRVLEHRSSQSWGTVRALRICMGSCLQPLWVGILRSGGASIQATTESFKSSNLIAQPAYGSSIRMRRWTTQLVALGSNTQRPLLRCRTCSTLGTTLMRLQRTRKQRWIYSTSVKKIPLPRPHGHASLTILSCQKTRV